MNWSEIEARLREKDAAANTQTIGATRFLRYRGGGISHTYDLKVAGEDAPYITKFASHDDPPRNALLVELAVARLAHLFTPTVAPEYAVIQVSPGLAGDRVCSEARCGLPINPGPAFGSKQLADAVDYRGGGRPPVGPQWAARVVAFQTWLDAPDPQLLIGTNQRGYSIDHGAYLPGAHTWDPERDPRPSVSLVCLDGLALDGSLRSPRYFEGFLRELGELNEEEIVDAFGAIPPGWWGPLDNRVQLAAYTLARRESLKSALEDLWGA